MAEAARVAGPDPDVVAEIIATSREIVDRASAAVEQSHRARQRRQAPLRQTTALSATAIKKPGQRTAP
jgi:hypothetical protein